MYEEIGGGNDDVFWYEGVFEKDHNVRFPSSPHWLSHFKSKHFTNISIKIKK